MKLAALVLVLGAQAVPSGQSTGATPGPTPGAASGAPGNSEPALPEPWTGTPEAAVRELRRLSLDGDHSDALALAARALLASREPGSTWSEARRAELDYGVGLTLLLAGDDLRLDVRGDAQSAFDSAAALAGPGNLRLDALYNGALVHLQWAEHRRDEIPEVVAAKAAGQSGVTGGPLQSSAMPPGIGDEEEAPDPLDLARAAYLQAREGFVRRLRAAWRAADTAANLELIERRLEELDEIERLREEQEQEQQEGEDSAPSEDGEEQENDEEQEDQEGQSEPEPGEDEQEQEQEQPPPGEEEQEQEPEEQESEPPPSEDEQEGELEPPTEQPEPTEAPAEEQHLTREEVVRLLDRLEQLEQDARELERAIQRQRRIPVERDW